MACSKNQIGTYQMNSLIDPVFFYSKIKLNQTEKNADRQNKHGTD